MASTAWPHSVRFGYVTVCDSLNEAQTVCLAVMCLYQDTDIFFGAVPAGHLDSFHADLVVQATDDTGEDADRELKVTVLDLPASMVLNFDTEPDDPHGVLHFDDLGSWPSLVCLRCQQALCGGPSAVLRSH